MRAALGRMDVVGEGVNVLLVGVVVLERNLHGGALHHALHVDGLLKEHFLVLVEVLDKLDDAALVVEHALGDGIGALVGKGDAHTLVEEGHLAQAGLQNVVLELAGFKHAVQVVRIVARVGPELDGGAGAVRFADHLQVVEHLAALVLLLIDLAVLIHGHLQVTAEGVDHAGAHAVQAAGYLVSLAAKLAAGVKHGQAHFHSGTAQLGVNAHGEAAAVVLHLAAAILVQDDVDIRAVASQRLVDGVVYNLIYAVMQPAIIRRADIHAGTLAHSLQAFEHLNLRFVIHMFFHSSRALDRRLVFGHVIDLGHQKSTPFGESFAGSCPFAGHAKPPRKRGDFCPYIIPFFHDKEKGFLPYYMGAWTKEAHISQENPAFSAFLQAVRKHLTILPTCAIILC